MSMMGRWAVGDHVFCSPLGEDMALLDTRTNQYFTLNPTAAAVWESLNKAESRDGIAVALSQKFDVSVKDCIDDVDEILKEFAAQNLICLADDGVAN